MHLLLGSTVVKETSDEEDLPTQQPAPRHATWLPPPHGGPRRPQGRALTSAQGPSASQCVTEALSRRRDFDRLRREGIRLRRGPIRMIARVDPTDVTRLAVALPRSVGSAVVRNRIRRRLRVVFRALDQAGQIPAGSYLVSFSSSSGPLESSELSWLMRDLMAQVPRRSIPRSPTEASWHDAFWHSSRSISTSGQEDHPRVVSCHHVHNMPSRRLSRMVQFGAAGSRRDVSVAVIPGEDTDTTPFLSTP